MIFIVDSDNDVINKEVVSLNYDISYPFFSNDDIDNYISGYLNYDSYIDGNTIIDYDIYDNDNLYYLTFYKYFWNDNMVSDGSDSFVIDTSNNSVSRINKTNYEYDVVINRKIDKSKKMIALTFDDGPNYNTSKIIDVLNKYDIKATFFVTNGGSEDVIKREYEEGHSIGLHTATHRWNIYSSVDTYFEDLNSVSDRVESITGEKSYLIRFPGGSSNTISRRYKKGIMTTLTSEVLNKGYHYFDWNVSVEDAGSCVKQKSYDNKKECIQNYFKKGLSKNRSNVVLMHDIKKYTADSLEEMINYAISKGYTFDRITMNTEQIHQRINN